MTPRSASAQQPTSVTIPYCPRIFQRQVHKGMQGRRFGVLVCHRRFGKTVLSVNHLIRGALTCQKERPRYGYIAPTYTQGKATSFDYFRHYSAAIPGRTVNQSELRVDFPNGGQTRIYGGDNPDSLRGLYFDGAVLDEYGLHAPKTFSEVVGPTLVDRGGWALLLGTPNGRNQFHDMAERAKREQADGNPDWFFREYKASDTGLLDAGYLAAAKAAMTPDEYAQEFECSFEASVKGAIYTTEIERARSTNRVTQVPYDPMLPVDTDWDLGIGDAMSIWFSQSTRSGEVRLIDYHETQGEGFPQLMTLLREKGYAYGTHWAPHDIQVRELGTGKSRLETAAGYGLRFEVTPRMHGQVGQEVEEGIHAVKMLFPRCWFDTVKCKPGLDALQNYRRDYNSRLNEFKATPVHDWASHGADAFRGLAVRHQTPREAQRHEPRTVSPPSADSWMAL